MEIDSLAMTSLSSELDYVAACCHWKAEIRLHQKWDRSIWLHMAVKNIPILTVFQPSFIRDRFFFVLPSSLNTILGVYLACYNVLKAQHLHTWLSHFNIHEGSPKNNIAVLDLFSKKHLIWQSNTKHVPKIDLSKSLDEEIATFLKLLNLEFK